MPPKTVSETKCDLNKTIKNNYWDMLIANISIFKNLK